MSKRKTVSPKVREISPVSIYSHNNVESLFEGGLLWGEVFRLKATFIANICILLCFYVYFRGVFYLLLLCYTYLCSNAICSNCDHFHHLTMYLLHKECKINQLFIV